MIGRHHLNTERDVAIRVALSERSTTCPSGVLCDEFLYDIKAARDAGRSRRRPGAGPIRAAARGTPRPCSQARRAHPGGSSPAGGATGTRQPRAAYLRDSSQGFRNARARAICPRRTGRLRDGQSHPDAYRRRTRNLPRPQASLRSTYGNLRPGENHEYGQSLGDGMALALNRVQSHSPTVPGDLLRRLFTTACKRGMCARIL